MPSLRAHRIRLGAPGGRAARAVRAATLGALLVAAAPAGAAAQGTASAPATALVPVAPATYTVTWDGQTAAMALWRDVTPRGRAVGMATDFQTNDPAYACFDGQSMPVYAHQRGLPARELLVHAVDSACTPRSGTWVFAVIAGGLRLAAQPALIGRWYVCTALRHRRVCTWLDLGRRSRVTAVASVDGRRQAGVPVAFAPPPPGTALSADTCTTGADGTCQVTFAVYAPPASTTAYALRATAQGAAAAVRVTYGVHAGPGPATVRLRALPPLLGWVRRCTARRCTWIFLGRTGRVVVAVRRAGAPLRGASVRLLAPGAPRLALQPARCVTDARGTCSVRLRVLRAPRASRRYRLLAFAAGARAATWVRYGTRPPAVPASRSARRPRPTAPSARPAAAAAGLA